MAAYNDLSFQNSQSQILQDDAINETVNKLQETSNNESLREIDMRQERIVSNYLHKHFYKKVFKDYEIYQVVDRALQYKGADTILLHKKYNKKIPDVIFNKNGSVNDEGLKWIHDHGMIIDEKTALHYAGNNRDTFSMEYYSNQGHNQEERLVPGWFLNGVEADNYTTDFLYIWLILRQYIDKKLGVSSVHWKTFKEPDMMALYLQLVNKDKLKSYFIKKSSIIYNNIDEIMNVLKRKNLPKNIKIEGKTYEIVTSKRGNPYIQFKDDKIKKDNIRFFYSPELQEQSVTFTLTKHYMRPVATAEFFMIGDRLQTIQKFYDDKSYVTKEIRNREEELEGRDTVYLYAYRYLFNQWKFNKYIQVKDITNLTDDCRLISVKSDNKTNKLFNIYNDAYNQFKCFGVCLHDGKKYITNPFGLDYLEKDDYVGFLRCNTTIDFIPPDSKKNCRQADMLMVTKNPDTLHFYDYNVGILNIVPAQIITEIMPSLQEMASNLISCEMDAIYPNYDDNGVGCIKKNGKIYAIFSDEFFKKFSRGKWWFSKEGLVKYTDFYD